MKENYAKEKIYISTGCGYEFDVGGNLARHSCLCFERTKRSGAMEVTIPLRRYFKKWALKKVKTGIIKQLFLFVKPLVEIKKEQLLYYSFLIFSLSHMRVT